MEQGNLAISLSFPVLQEEASGGKLVAVPHGARIPEGATSVPQGLRMPAHVVADATQRARLSGKVRRWRKGAERWELRSKGQWQLTSPNPPCREQTVSPTP
eukprot:768516-Hanusia_phi.AAC.4